MIQRQEFRVIALTIGSKDTSSQLEKFEQWVNEALAAGWELWGSMAVTESAGKSIILTQACVRRLGGR